MTNISNATIKGIEAQVQGRFGGLGFDAGIAYVDSKLDPVKVVNTRGLPALPQFGPQCPAGAPSNPPVCFDYGPYTVTAGGGPNLFSPEWSYNIGAQYEIALPGDMSLTPRLNYAYVGPRWTNLVYNPTLDYLNGRGLLSALITLRKGNWMVEGYATNLAKEKYVMKSYLIAGAALVAANPAWAQDLTLKPLVDARLRYETVDQAGLATETSDAVTARLRAGIQASSGPISALVEGEGTLAIVDSYFDGLHGAATRPLIADPQNIALYRAQLQYKSKVLTLTAGRQRISLDDDRFVDAALFRQNSQSYDAVRAEWAITPKLKADISYVWSVRTVWGIDGNGARPTRIDGDNIFANLSYATPAGTLTAYAYLVDQDDAAVQNFRMSNQTYGAKFQGSQKLSSKAKLSYQLSFARQSDYHRNPNNYAASFYLVDAMLDVAAFKLGGGLEVLGADQGVTLASFQTSVGTGFRYRGWAGKFVPNPPDGVRDYYGTLGWGAPKLGPLTGVTVQATFHRFTSDRLVRPYGSEIDLLVSAKVKKATLSARFAHYDAEAFATDTRKLWLQLDWVY